RFPFLYEFLIPESGSQSSATASLLMPYARHRATGSKLICHRIVRVGIVVESLAGFAPIPAGHHQPLQEWRRGEAALLEFIEHYLCDVVRGIQTDKVQQGERSHGITATQLHGIVNIGNGTDAFFISADCVQQIRDQQTINYKSSFVAGANR